jgi:UDP-N-acetylglucosamine 2-epimerase (non-hydrolysing)
VRVLSVVGARPNFLKLAPVDRALVQSQEVEHIVVHTGQHYDREMSDDLFHDLQIPPPVINLAVGSSSHAHQTAAVMQRLDPVLAELEPDVVLVYGDVNSTLAAALVAAKMGIRVGHVEAGLRSRDWTMPEEINRTVTDRLSDLLFVPSREAAANLLAEGVPESRIHFVGNIMIDSLVHALPLARELHAAASMGLTPRRYTVVTLHRPSNVDDPATFTKLLETMGELSQGGPVIFPMHPRTKACLIRYSPANPDFRILDPLGYVEMLSLVATAGLVVTDSGGLQEETTFLGVPCLTVRHNTERPITCTAGTNELVTPSRNAILQAANRAHRRRMEGGARLEHWDGAAAGRIVEVLLTLRTPRHQAALETAIA